MDLDGRCASTPSTSAAGAGGTTENGNQQQTTATTATDLVTFEANFVSIVAEQLGIDFPTSSSGQAVAQSVSSFLRRVFKMARKFQKSSRRKWLTQDDLEVAMAYFGYSPLLGYDTMDSTTFRQFGKQTRELFVREDPELELMAVIHSTPPKLPLEPSLKAHWLAINGTQPAIAENPLPIVPTDLAFTSTAGGSGMDAEAGTSQEKGAGGLLLNQLAKTVQKTEQVQIKQMTTHALSMEQQVFFLKIMEAIMGQDEQKRIEALNCLQMDCGLRALMSRFSIAITEGVRCNIVVHNMAILVYLMRMIQALSQNVAITLEPCLHELLPTMMSCILSRQLSSNQQASDTHCVLREFSSDLLAQLLRRYRLPHIHTRVIRVLSKAFEQPNCALSTLYGAVTALCELGPEVIQRVILPNMPMICATLQRVLFDKLYSHERSLGKKLYDRMLEKLTAVAKDPGCEIPLRHYQDFQNAFGIFADDIYKAFKTTTNNKNNNNNVGQLYNNNNNNNLAK